MAKLPTPWAAPIRPPKAVFAVSMTEEISPFNFDMVAAFDTFVSNYQFTLYGNLLIQAYIKSVSDISLLHTLEGSDKFMMKLTDEERLEIKEKGIQAGKREGRQKKHLPLQKVCLLMDCPQVL